MMTSSNGNIFRVTGHLCGEFIGPRWIPSTKASDAELWCFLWSAPRINGWVNNGEAGDLRRYRAHYDVTVMCYMCCEISCTYHYSDVTMGAMASLITSLTSVYSNVHPGADQRKHQSSASLAFVRRIHRRPGNSPHIWPVTRKFFPFDDVIMIALKLVRDPYGDVWWYYDNCNHHDGIRESINWM